MGSTNKLRHVTTQSWGVVNAISAFVIDTEASGLISHIFLSLTGLGLMGTMEPLVFAAVREE